MSAMQSEPEFPPGEPAPEVLDDRIWVDGCWDFFHHGHAGAMLQARQLGTELYVGIHSDESILENKGPTVMNLEERISAVDACRWVTKSIPYAPYVTSLPWITHYGCKYVVHGDDITSDSSGEDCYRYVKTAGRFKVVKRTPSISTTDLVGRMLLCTKTHFIKSLPSVLDGEEGSGPAAERKREGKEMLERMKVYATDASGLQPGPGVWFWTASAESGGVFSTLCKGSSPQPGQRVAYVGGGFDLFSSGHIAFLRQVIETEEQIGRDEGWYSEQSIQERKGKGADYGPVFVVAGVHDDLDINSHKGINYPIMNIYERGLCVLQCKYIDSVIFGAPYTPTRSFLTSTPWGVPDVVYHGLTNTPSPSSTDRYADVKQMGIYKKLGEHPFATVTAKEIVDRILKSREMYEERQRKKGAKVAGEEAVKRREEMEEELRRRGGGSA